MNEKQSIMAGHPARKSLQGIPEIVSPEEERYEIIRQSCISLKKLFARENMDLYHVDCLVLYRIASGVLHIMEELSLRHIFPGLYDLNDICVDLQNGCQVYLLNPDRFQLPGSDQDYEWYPEDERLFGDIDRFDEDAQKLADTRLIYKILVASAKGNVKIPPKETNADYSALFYKTLSPEWKDLFLKEEGVRHDRLKALLSDSIALERESAGYVRRRRYERVKRQFEDTAGPADSDQGDKHQPAVGDPDTSSEHQPVVIDSETGNEHQSSGSVYSMFALLRTETRHSGRIGRMLYQQQDQLELEARLSHMSSLQAFVYGNGSVYSRDYREYPRGFRMALEQQIRDYSAGEAMIIASEYIEKSSSQQDAEHRLYLIADGRLKNDHVFSYALARLEALKDKGLKIYFVFNPENRCEAYEKIEKLID